MAEGSLESKGTYIINILNRSSKIRRLDKKIAFFYKAFIVRVDSPTRKKILPDTQMYS